MKIIKKIPVIIAAGFGLGYAPFASGTFGSLLGCLIVWTLTILKTPLWLQIVLCAAMTLACIPICTFAERALGGIKDNGKIVADEYLTFPICMLGMYDLWQDNWWLMPMCFAVCRFMDIVKPFPAYRSQKLAAGWGITIDDLIASLYALAVNWILLSVFFLNNIDNA